MGGAFFWRQFRASIREYTKQALFSGKFCRSARARATKIKVTGLEMAQKVRLGSKLFFLPLFRLGSEWRVANFGFPRGNKRQGWKP